MAGEKSTTWLIRIPVISGLQSVLPHSLTPLLPNPNPVCTLNDRINGHLPLPERRPANIKITILEEEVIIQNILDLDSRGFAPRLASVEDIANYILESRGGKHVSKLWAH